MLLLREWIIAYFTSFFDSSHRCCFRHWHCRSVAVNRFALEWAPFEWHHCAWWIVSCAAVCNVAIAESPGRRWICSIASWRFHDGNARIAEDRESTNTSGIWDSVRIAAPSSTANISGSWWRRRLWRSHAGPGLSKSIGETIELVLVHLHMTWMVNVLMLTVKVVGIRQALNELQFHLEAKTLCIFRLNGYCKIAQWN